MSDWLQKIAITKIPKVGPVTARNLISYCGGLEGVFEARKRELEKIPNVGAKIAQVIINKDYFKEAEKELRFLENQEIKPLFFLDDDFPHRLKVLDDAPVLLYYKGTTNLNHPRIVAIVGTRKPSPLGTAICEELVEGLKVYNVLIVSGLAYGIDATAHKKSLELGIDTIGVLGHGLKQIYPSQHRQLAQKMLEKGGLLTEFTSDKGPDREHFPMRNRIVAGMCDALIVVETSIKGGSMISAQYGNEYSKDVFAFPGGIKDAYHQGCNHLIKTHKAALIESAKDIGYIMRWEETNQEEAEKKLLIKLTDQEQIIADLLKQSEEISIDQLTYESKLGTNVVASLLLMLEFKGLVRALPGKRYIMI